MKLTFAELSQFRFGPDADWRDRLVFADWLEDRGEPEEAANQRHHARLGQAREKADRLAVDLHRDHGARRDDWRLRLELADALEACGDYEAALAQREIAGRTRALAAG